MTTFLIDILFCTMLKFIEIDPNLLLASLSCEMGQQNNQISLHWVKLESFSALLKITGLAPTRRYLNSFVAPIRMKS